MGDQTENVCLNLLTNPIAYTQQGIVNVNTHVMGINEEVANAARMKVIMEIIYPLMDNKTYWMEDDAITLHLQIEDDKGIFRSVEQKGKFFYNLRINFLTL